MDERERVAVIIPLDKRKKDLLPLLVPKWNQIDYGDRDVVYVAIAEDADEETVAEFGRLIDPDADVLPVHTDPPVRRTIFLYNRVGEQSGDMGHYNPIFLHYMSELRELGRQTALALHAHPDTAGRPVDWFFWLDQDVDPGPDGFKTLLADLTDSTGPGRPRAASGLYCTRYEGQPIGFLPQHNKVHFSEVCGFGCVVTDRETMEHVGFGEYGKYRTQRLGDLELGKKPQGVLGEDCLWVYLLKKWCGVPILTDCRVLCDHYHADGSFWRFEVDEMTGEDACLVARYHEETRIPAAMVGVKNIGSEAVSLVEYGLVIQPGGHMAMSPEQRDKFHERYPGKLRDVEVVPEPVWSDAIKVGDTTVRAHACGDSPSAVYPTFESIDAAVNRLYGARDGWCHPDERRRLYELAKGSPGNAVVEIGTWKGLSTCFLAAAGKQVYAFDPYAFETWQATKEWPQHPDNEKAQEFAGRQWVALGLNARIEQHIAASPQCLAEMNGRLPSLFGLVFVDGLHTYEGALADMQAWGPRVAPGGYLLLHDYLNLGDAHAEGVAPAAKDALSPEEWETLGVVHSMAVYQRRDL